MTFRSLLMFSMLAVSATHVGADRINRALQQANASGRPLLVIGSSESCGPCRRLHAEMGSEELQDVLRRCVVLTMDGRSREFAEFVRKFPADARLMPMVYVILPNETPMYARSGGMSRRALKELLDEAIAFSTAIHATEESAAGNKILATARERAKSGELIEALQTLQQLDGQSLPSDVQAKFLTYQDRLTSAIRQWLSDLDQQMHQGELMHGAAYRIAEVYVALPACADVRTAAGELLRRYENDNTTRIAVRQAKHLLVARYHENRRLCRKALQHYSLVLTIDESTPAADFAKERIARLRRKTSEKLLSQNSLP